MVCDEEACCSCDDASPGREVVSGMIVGFREFEGGFSNLELKIGAVQRGVW